MVGGKGNVRYIMPVHHIKMERITPAFQLAWSLSKAGESDANSERADLHQDHSVQSSLTALMDKSCSFSRISLASDPAADNDVVDRRTF